MLFVLALTLVSCSQKKETPVENPDKRPKQYVYEQLMAHNTPQAFERLMFMPVMGNGTLLYMFEKMYPECSGIYDSTGFYSDACDNGSWVENLIFSLEEARMGDEMLSLLEDEDSILPPIDFTEQENEIAAIETSVEKLLADSYGKLKVMEFANERFFLQPAEQGQILIHYSNNLAIRAFYDELFRLVKKEHWKMNTIEDSGITATELYEYEGEEKNPVKKIIQNDAAKVVSNYDQNGLVIKAQKYSIAGEEDKKTEQLINITEYEYDSKQRITVQTSTDMSYNTSGKLAKKTVKKQLFDYKKSDAASAKASPVRLRIL